MEALLTFHTSPPTLPCSLKAFPKPSGPPEEILLVLDISLATHSPRGLLGRNVALRGNAEWDLFSGHLRKWLEPWCIDVRARISDLLCGRTYRRALERRLSHAVDADAADDFTVTSPRFTLSRRRRAMPMQRVRL